MNRELQKLFRNYTKMKLRTNKPDSSSQLNFFHGTEIKQLRFFLDSHISVNDFISAQQIINMNKLTTYSLMLDFYLSSCSNIT